MCLITITPVLAIPGTKLEMPGIGCEAVLLLYGTYTCSINACWRIWVEIVNPEDGATYRIPFNMCDAHLRPYLTGQRDCGIHHEPFTVKLAT